MLIAILGATAGASALALHLFPERIPARIRMQFATASAVRAFEDKGCAGPLEVEDALPHVWRVQGKGANALWVERIEGCGYNRARSPSARIGGGIVDLTYTLVDTDGVLAACLCRYRSIFVLDAPVADSDVVTVAGLRARWGPRAATP